MTKGKAKLADQLSTRDQICQEKILDFSYHAHILQSSGFATARQKIIDSTTSLSKVSQNKVKIADYLLIALKYFQLLSC